MYVFLTFDAAPLSFFASDAFRLFAKCVGAVVGPLLNVTDHPSLFRADAAVWSGHCVEGILLFRSQVKHRFFARGGCMSFCSFSDGHCVSLCPSLIAEAYCGC